MLIARSYLCMGHSRARLYISFYVIAIALSYFPITSDTAIQTEETRLQEDLFRKHNRYIIPLQNKSKALQVEYDFQLIRIIDVNERNQYIKTYAWVNQFWKDELLTWDPKKYGGVDQIHVSPLVMWVPDILLYNNVDEEDRLAGGYNTFKAQVSLTYDGNVTWLNPAIFKSVCQIDVTYFPFDDQTCELKFGSWSYDAKRIDVYPRLNYVGLNQNYIANGEWTLLKIAAKRNAKKYVCCPNEFVDVSVRFTIQRESIDYILKLIIPCALISSMIFLGFILPPESGERIGLSITVLLAMTVFQQFTSEIMPSYGFPLLGQYYFATIIQIGLSLLVTTTNLNFYHRNKSRMPNVLRKVINEWLYRLVFPYKCQEGLKPREGKCRSCFVATKSRSERLSDHFKQDYDTNLSSTKEDQRPLKSEICTYDPWIRMEDYKKQEESTNKKPCKHNLMTDENGTKDKSQIYFKIENSSALQSTDPFPNHLQVQTCSENLLGEPQVRRGSPCIHDRADLMRRASFMSTGLPNSLMMATMDITEEQIEHHEEWMKAARVLDRLFLILSILSGSITLLAIFLRAPRFANPG